MRPCDTWKTQKNEGLQDCDSKETHKKVRQWQFGNPTVAYLVWGGFSLISFASLEKVISPSGSGFLGLFWILQFFMSHLYFSEVLLFLDYMELFKKIQNIEPLPKGTGRFPLFPTIVLWSLFMWHSSPLCTSWQSMNWNEAHLSFLVKRCLHRPITIPSPSSPLSDESRWRAPWVPRGIYSHPRPARYAPPLYPRHFTNRDA